MDAFEEKWEKKFRGDDHYWLTRPAHTVGAQAHTVTGGQETPFKDHGDEMVVSIVMGVSQ